MTYIKDTISINRKYKDSLFCLIFGDEENKKNILSLYNALNNTDYTNMDDLEITTIEDAVYIKMKNDVSFLIDSYLSLWEHQSTYNPNMPIRGLMYYGNLYNSYINEKGLNIYSSELVELPTPQYVVFYNGDKKKASVEKLRLSKAFTRECINGEFEWTATMLNLNTGKNDELLSKCKALSDYMALINKIKYYKKQTTNIKDAIELAVNECIQEDIMAEFLRKHRSEVMCTCLTEFNEEVYKKGLLEEGRKEGRNSAIRKLYLHNMSCEKIAEILEMSEEEVRHIKENIKE